MTARRRPSPPAAARTWSPPTTPPGPRRVYTRITRPGTKGACASNITLAHARRLVAAGYTLDRTPDAWKDPA